MSCECDILGFIPKPELTAQLRVSRPGKGAARPTRTEGHRRQSVGDLADPAPVLPISSRWNTEGKMLFPESSERLVV
jgi:hypothetical protein